MGEQLGNIRTIYNSVDAGSSYQKVGEIKDSNHDINQTLHNVTSADDGAFMTDLRGHKNGTMTATCNRDQADVAQNNIRAAIIAGTDTLWQVRDDGDGSGLAQLAFAGNFTTQGVPSPVEGPQDFTFTVQTTGVIDDTPQP